MGKPWFTAKRFGYGSGMPCSWEGWTVLIGYLAVVAASAVTATEANVKSHMAVIMIASAALVLICARTTRGGWRWRWGQD
ncbi:MAG: hypothetical protein ACOYM5_03635 [Caulobacter sp.]